MKTVATLLLVFFISFLITPAIVSVLVDDIEFSECNDILDDDSFEKDFKAVFMTETFIKNIFFQTKTSKLIVAHTTEKHNSVSFKIFSPPPELI